MVPYSTTAEYTWHIRAGIQRRGKKNYSLKEEEAGDGRADGSPETADGEPAAISLAPDTGRAGSLFPLDSSLSVYLLISGHPELE